MSADSDIQKAKRRSLLRHFWRTANLFWTGKNRSRSWMLTSALALLVVGQVFIQYRINVWNRAIFDALEQKNSSEVLFQALVFFPLALASIALAVAIVWGRTTTQREWRRWLTLHLVDRWLEHGRYYHLNLVSGDHDNPEHRIAEDVRVATEAPVDFGQGLLAALLSAATFITVLWVVGGDLTFTLGGSTVTIPGFLVVAAVLYAFIASGAMVWIGRRYVIASEKKMQSEAELRYALTRLRENGESIALIAGEEEEKIGLTNSLNGVIHGWREVMRQYMRTTTVAQTSFLVAPVIPVILSAPKFLDGSMSLGQVMQAASAFVTVQTAFNWLVDNYPRFADWSASARRVSSLLVSLDALEKAEKSEGIGRIKRSDAREGIALQLRDVSVALDNGAVVVNDADVEIAPGEKVLFVGESGSGKSTLVRAIAGLWPWGEGEISIKPGAKMFLMPQRPYIPLGALRRAVIYPMAADEVDDAKVRDAMEAVGLNEHLDKLDEDGPWDQTLSGGEKQRVAFARLLIHEPDIIVMDESTSALDKESQRILMERIEKQLPGTTVLSVGHRPELEEFHERKITLEHRPGGAQIVGDIDLPTVQSRGLLRRLWRRRAPPDRTPSPRPGIEARDRAPLH
jgi:vitamin B12/bleomycin/antimicrobial peptide transport system ATP-binding/permease protein